MTPRKRLQIVCKISKYCNLRCNYCYEYAELGNRARMGLDEIGRMFSTLRRHVDDDPSVESIVFYWQGGEPLLIKPDVYRAIGKLSEQTFAGSIPVIHTVQTNLTVLSPSWREFLKNGEFFSDVGISFDVVGEQRVDVEGKPRNTQVLSNLQKLLDDGVSFAAISVVARHSLDHVGEIYRFYDGLGIEMRFLPFYVSAFDEQVAAHGLTGEQIISALCAVFDLWMASEQATSVEPLRTYLDFALDHIRGRKPSERYVALQESLFLVNPAGDTWGMADMYGPDACYGNIFSDGFAEMLRSPARQRAMTEARERLDKTCAGCPYFGACPGYAVAFASPVERELIASSGCVARGVLNHIVARLDETGFADRLQLPQDEGGEALRVAL